MFTPPTFIDGLFDYLPLLKDGPLCEIPPQTQGTKIAIVGAGASGLLIGHELLKMGLEPVIYEASDRVGGRLYTKRFEQIQDDNPPFAELGAMRIPRSSLIFFHYAKKLGLNFDYKFPSPGTVNSAIYYRNKLHYFSPTQALPLQFDQIRILWELFANNLVRPIHEEWEKGNIDRVRMLWQMYIEQFKNKSFYEVLYERSPILKANQINLFGALGIGSGGFNSVFQVSFLEILRIMINGYIESLVLISQGASQFAEKLYRLPVTTPAGVTTSLEKMQCVKLNTPVVLLDYNTETKRPILQIKRQDKSIERVEYPATVFTGSMCAAHLINLSEKTKSGVFLFSDSVRNAIRSSYAIASSKTYICTKNKFWLEKELPRCILTDGLTKATYFLDYPHTQHGVVCMSYSWGIDAMKINAVEPKDRLVMFRRIMEEISPELNKNLEPLNNEVICIDWINQKYQNGAFKLLTPGYDGKQKKIYFQFQSVLTEDDKGIYLAGDSVSWSGGWVEGALYTGINAIYAVAKRLNAQIPKGTPLDQPYDLYHY